MTSTNQAVERIVARIGFPRPRVKAVATYLTAAGVLPSGGPGKSPDLDVTHFVDLLIGCAADVPLRAVGDAVRKYRQLGLPGHDANGMPASVAAKFHGAGDHLDVLAEMAARGTLDAQRDVARMHLEFVATWPEIALHHVDGSIQRFRPSGTLAGFWQHAGHRTSTTINGGSFVSAVCDLFVGE